jgi:energy-coupling factor transport system ATP-binding protein
MAPLIEVQGVWFDFRPEARARADWILRKVDWTVEPGEYVALMGRNGSGKSTLARMLNGLLVPTEGRVRVKGIPTDDPKRLWMVRKTVGMVFQNPENQHVAPTVREDVAFGLENLGLPRKEMLRRIDEALEAVGLSGMEERQIHQLSGGQKQLLAIAGVIAMRPEAIVLDEATSMLDPAAGCRVLEVVRRLNEGGMAVIHITHSAEEAARAGRVAVLDRGRIVLDGPPEEVFLRDEELRHLGLEVPVLAELTGRLRRRGWSLSETLDPERWVEEIWRLLSRG